MNDTVQKDPIDKKALVFVICAAVFLCSLIFLIARNDMTFGAAHAAVSGAPGSNDSQSK
jgi:hypothetical protein